MIPRHLTPHLLAALTDTPIVFLRGPRQTGKTTLVRSLMDGEHPAAYRTFDDVTVLQAAAADPRGFLAAHDGPLILDEVQRVPELYLALKESVDRNRQPGRYLLTGSADVLLLPQVAEYLAGRMEVLTLWPFSVAELTQAGAGFIDAAFRVGPIPPAPPPCAFGDLVRRVVCGGYPEVQNRAPARRRAWFGSYLATILQRDIRDLASITGLSELPRLLSLLAARTGQLLSYSDLARTIGIPQTTLKRYIALLQAALLVQFIPAWFANVGRRLAKAPKVLLTDTGLAAHLLGADEERVMASPELRGQLTESFVLGELVKQISWSSTQPALFHYRTHGQREVDVVLESPAGDLVGIEIKSSASVAGADLKGLRDLADAAGSRFLRGMVLYSGSEVVPFSPNLHAVPLAALWDW